MTRIYQYENKEYGLVPFTEDMVETSNYRNWFYDREVTKYNSHGLFPYTIKKMKSFFASLNDGSNITYAIFKKSIKADDVPESPITDITIHPEKHIGNVSLQSINLINCSAEFAIIIGDKKETGKGLGKQITSLMLHHAFEKLGLNRVWSGTSQLNMGMNKIFNRLNWRKEGVFTQGMWNNGSFVNINFYAFLRVDWYGSFAKDLLVDEGWLL